MKWIKSHKLIVFLLAIVLISGIFVVFSASYGGRSGRLSGFTGTMLTAAEKPLARLSNTISENISGIFSYKKYQKENTALKEENAELKKQVAALSLSDKELQELRELSGALNYSLPDRENSLVTADITSTGMSSASWMHLFTINRGTESGIKEGAVVVYGSGLVGRVSAAGKGWSKVVSIIDESNKVSFSVTGKLEFVGIIEDSTDGLLNGFMLDNRAKVEEGDALQTSGLGIYPAGLEIGKITKLKADSDSQLLRIKVKPSVNFRKLQKVSVIL